MYYPSLHKMTLDHYNQVKSIVRLWLTMHINSSYLKDHTDSGDPVVEEFVSGFVRQYLEAVCLSPEFMNGNAEVSTEELQPYLLQAKQALEQLALGDYESIKQKFDFSVDPKGSGSLFTTIVSIIKIGNMYFEVLGSSDKSRKLPAVVAIYSESIFKLYESEGFLRVGNSEWAFEVYDSKNYVIRKLENQELPKLYNANIKIVRKKNSRVAYVTLHQSNELVDSFYISRVEDLISANSFYGFALYSLAKRNKNVVGHLRVKSNYQPDETNKNYRQYMRIVTTLFPVMQIEYAKKISVLKSKIKERVSYTEQTFNVRAKACNVETNIGNVAIKQHSIIRYLERSVRWLNHYPSKPYDSFCNLLKNNVWRLATDEDRIEFSLPSNESKLYISDTTDFVLACEVNEVSYELSHLLTVLCKGNEETVPDDYNTSHLDDSDIA